MRTWFFALALTSVGSAEAEWLVLRDGQRSEVRHIEVVGRSVRVVTLAGKTWVLLADVVDLEATEKANEALAAKQEAGSRPSPARLSAGTLSQRERVRNTPPVPPQPPRAVAPVPSPAQTVPAPIAPAPAPAGPIPEEVRPPPVPPPEQPTRGPITGHRFAFFVNGVAGTKGLELNESRRFDLFREEASLDSLYLDSEPRGYEVGALFLVVPRFGVVASAELFDGRREASFVASLPHPFFYDQAREFTGSFSDVDHVERTFHVGPVLSLAIGNRVSVDVFGGPSLFWTRSELLTDVGYDEVFPFNDVVPTGAVFEIFENRSWGYHVGASTSFRIVGIFGLDLIARYSRARVRLEPGAERELTFDAGGLRFGAGIRLLIP